MSGAKVSSQWHRAFRQRNRHENDTLEFGTSEQLSFDRPRTQDGQAVFHACNFSATRWNTLTGFAVWRGQLGQECSRHGRSDALAGRQDRDNENSRTRFTDKRTDSERVLTEGENCASIF
jgi:hypothetical protein